MLVGDEQSGYEPDGGMTLPQGRLNNKFSTIEGLIRVPLRLTRLTQMIEAALDNHLQGIILQRFNRVGLGIGIP